MEPKKYQTRALNELKNFLSELIQNKTITEAWNNYFYQKASGQEEFGAYNEAIKDVPDITLKIPTAGGKTVVAVWSIGIIFNEIDRNNKPRFVLWLVPTDGILTQTLNNLNNPNHPYRIELDKMFSGRVNIVSRQQMLDGENFTANVMEDVCTIAVMTFASLRIKRQSKETRKAYQANGNLMTFPEKYAAEDGLEDVDKTALINVIRSLNPLVIVDESHNATSELSLEMLERVNPFFILNLTATPKENANILTEIYPYELKEENMIKLPLIVYNRRNPSDVLIDAISLREGLEELAIENEKETGDYIRPAVLLQAQPRIGKNKETFEKIRKELIKLGIPENEIAIKTAEIDELKGIDLNSRSCPVRYIITVNALKEGWDYPNAYVLANVADKKSETDVEQIIGRVLRQPYCKKAGNELLSTSFALTSSDDFAETMKRIIDGLNISGVGADMVFGINMDEINIPEEEEPLETGPNQEEAETETAEESESKTENIPLDTNEAAGLSVNLEDKPSGTEKPPETGSSSIESREITGSGGNEKENKNSSGFFNQVQDNVGAIGKGGAVPGRISGGNSGAETGTGGTQTRFTETGSSPVKESRIREEFRNETELLPKFVLAGTLFSNNLVATAANFNSDFKLSRIEVPLKYVPELSKNIGVINLEKDKGFFSQYQTPESEDYLRSLIDNNPDQKDLIMLKDRVLSRLNKDNRFTSKELEAFLDRILEEYNKDEITQLLKDYSGFTNHLQEYIRKSVRSHSKRNFLNKFDTNQISVNTLFKMPEKINISRPDKYVYRKSLYTLEEKTSNSLEDAFMKRVDTIDNVLWWHKLDQSSSLKKDFYINGFINYHPDFIIKTKNGTIIIVETKAAVLSNQDTRDKLELGKCWAEKSGNNYKYFLVFDKKAPGLPERSTTIDEIFRIIESL